MRYILIVAVALLMGAVWEKSADASDLRQTLAICQSAHRETDGASEQRCGDMQDKTHTEFICSQTGAYCWLEVK